MTKKRFTEIISTQKIRDNKTGKEYHGIVDDQFFNLINQLAEEEPIVLQSHVSDKEFYQIKTALERYSIGKDGLIRDYNRQIDNDEILQKLNKCENKKIEQAKQIQQLRETQKLIVRTLYLRGYKGVGEIESIIKR